MWRSCYTYVVFVYVVVDVVDVDIVGSGGPYPDARRSEIPRPFDRKERSGHPEVIPGSRSEHQLRKTGSSHHHWIRRENENGQGGADEDHLRPRKNNTQLSFVLFISFKFIHCSPFSVTEGVAKHSSRLQPSINLHAQLQPCNSAARVPKVLPRRDEGSGKPCAMIEAL